MKIKKRHLTLLETLIALCLVAFLLSLVFSFFSELGEGTRLTELQQKKSFQQRYAESRLFYIFSRILNENASGIKEHFYFFTEKPQREFSPATSLVFTFNNGVRLPPTFSGIILGRLYVDLEERLCLATWPLVGEDPTLEMQHEIVLEKVKDMHVTCYAAPPRLSGKNDSQPAQIDPSQPRKGEWHEDEWPQIYEQMPSIVKLKLKVEEGNGEGKANRKSSGNPERELEWAFVLPSSQNYIYYPP